MQQDAGQDNQCSSSDEGSFHNKHLSNGSRSPIYLKASALGLRCDADPADVQHIFRLPLNGESFFISRTSQFRSWCSINSQSCDITERSRRRSVRELHTGSPRSDHRIASLASEQQCYQHPDQQEVRGVRNQIERPGPLISQAIRNLIGIQRRAVGEGDTNRNKFEGRRCQQTKVGPCQPAPPAALSGPHHLGFFYFLAQCLTDCRIRTLH